VKLEEVVRSLDADRAMLETRLGVYTAQSPDAWQNILVGMLEGTLLATTRALYLLHLVNISGTDPDGRL